MENFTKEQLFILRDKPLELYILSLENQLKKLEYGSVVHQTITACKELAQDILEQSKSIKEQLQ